MSLTIPGMKTRLDFDRSNGQKYYYSEESLENRSFIEVILDHVSFEMQRKARISLFILPKQQSK